MRVLALILLITLSYANSKQCADKKSQCPDGTTCCELKSGAFGCCPYDGAACCSDKEHCCPGGYTCDVEQGRCLQQEGNGFLAYLGMFEKIAPTAEIVAKKPVEDVISCIIQHLPALEADINRIVADAKSMNIQDLVSAIQQLIGDGESTVEECSKQ